MSLKLFDLTGRRALVTGSTKGIGLAIAQGLAGAGCEIIINGRDEARLRAAADALREAGITVSALAFDVTEQEAVTAAVDRMEKSIGPIDILVNNAGMQFRRAPRELSRRQVARAHARQCRKHVSRKPGGGPAYDRP